MHGLLFWLASVTDPSVGIGIQCIEILGSISAVNPFIAQEFRMPALPSADELLRLARCLTASLTCMTRLTT